MPDANKSPYESSDSDSDMERAYKDLMKGLDTTYQNAVGAKDNEKPAPKQPNQPGA